MSKIKKDDDGGLVLTPEQAAPILGICAAGVRYWCRKGAIGFKRPGSQWRIKASELAAFGEKPRKRGPVPKKRK